MTPLFMTIAADTMEIAKKVMIVEKLISVGANVNVTCT